MSAEVMFAPATGRETVRSEQTLIAPAAGWNSKDFAREQIRGLVQQVFFSNVERPVRQILFNAVDQQTDVRAICRQVGEALALETTGSIAVVGDYPQAVLDGEGCCEEENGRSARDRRAGLQQVSIRLSGNLWLLPAAAQEAGPRNNPASWKSYLGEMRREFEYSIVGAPFSGEWNEATAMARFADGIILVLSAHRTRRIRARYMKNKLEAAQAHILGTVLSDRIFPIPEGIYRRL
jgi:hypothetical protein